MAFIVVYDACVLYSNTVRDLLIRLAISGVVQAKWSEEILNEVDRNLDKNGIGTPESRARRREQMNTAIPDVLVTGYEDLTAGLKLPDENDRHVLAAAIKAGAQVIVTDNLRDFPPDYLAQYGIEAKSADDFVMDLIDMFDRVVYSCAQAMADNCRLPPQTLDDILVKLERSGLIESANALRSGSIPPV
jgi:predicted nucleic acid-binding protein